jgi:hypothetical protein
MRQLASVQPHVAIQMRSRHGQGMFVTGDVHLLPLLSAVMDAHGAHGLPAQHLVALVHKPVLIIVAIVSSVPATHTRVVDLEVVVPIRYAHGAHGLPARCRVGLAYKPVLIPVVVVSNARVIWDLAVRQVHGHRVLHTVEGGLNLVRILVTLTELKHVAVIPIPANVLELGLLVPPLLAVSQVHKQKSGR